MTNDIEYAIKVILVKNGYSEKDISLHDERIETINKPIEYRYLKVGYWRRLDVKAQRDLGKLITAELTDTDTDLNSFLWSYIVKKS